MDKIPLISVALCTFNGQRFLKEQLDSLISQSYSNIEIIIVDDCSTDLTYDILLSYSATYPIIRLHSNESRLGYNKNFEKALKLCNGEFIAICDQDDIWNKDKLEVQLKAIQTNMLVYCDSDLIDSIGKTMNRKMSGKFNFYKGSLPETFLFMNCVSGHTILMRRSLLPYALPFPSEFHYDQWLAYVACCVGSIDFVSESLVQYRIHDHNCTNLLSSANKCTGASRPREKILIESGWLKTCSQIVSASQHFVTSLYLKSLERNDAFFHCSYALMIWKNRKSLLHIPKKSSVSKLFFIIKKSWGLKAKRLISATCII
ncbi:glycosyltransferase family 2 protein [Dyadobacter crusticola]|uniref:glycosyltransferase family 2 protein n=1 Tax=Dyadobacter crusticola TaxID=292407 RepID=UPI000553854E|nr:glycosyltransferase family 2 protein [Dyadobacter crusticola]